MKHKLYPVIIFLISFILWTFMLLTVDLQPIGPMESTVGLASVNGWFHSLTGVHMDFYEITDLLSIIPLGIVLYFGIMGLIQWIIRKKIRLVDYDILVLGGFYVVVMVLFLLFEIWVVNYRPILIEGILEASYPSSTTMLVMCVIPTAMIQCHRRIKNTAARRYLLLILGIFMLLMVIGRLLSGVHWLTDIIGGALLSAGLVMMYDFVCSLCKKKSL